MKSFYCKECNKRGKTFSGLRPEVRKHIREEHTRIPADYNNFVGKTQLINGEWVEEILFMPKKKK